MMRFKKKQCNCCLNYHITEYTLIADSIIDLDDYYGNQPNPFKRNGKNITHQADCQCGSTLYLEEITEEDEAC
jgi:hypothetical protein